MDFIIGCQTFQQFILQCLDFTLKPAKNAWKKLAVLGNNNEVIHNTMKHQWCEPSAGA